MDKFALLVDLHRGGARQGPGSPETTRRAIALAGLAGRGGLRIADVGCGTGASALVLARDLDAHITAVDLSAEFLADLDAAALREGLGARIATLRAPMEKLPFAPGSLDAIWSEGAIYSMGFAAGIAAWRPFLRPGGILAVSDLTWLGARRPAALTRYWEAEYPEVATAPAKTAALKAAGYRMLGWFALPPACWLEHFYTPLRARFAGFLARHEGSAAAAALVAAEEAEIALYERHGAHVGYGFYIAARTDDMPPAPPRAPRAGRRP
jgi:SAM-dependent methyltransferase